MVGQYNFDAVIIGGGPAGISCASELKDSGLTSVILERSGRLGGQLSDVPNPLRNFAGGNYSSGEQLRGKLVELVEAMKFSYELNCNIQEIDLVDKTIVANGRKLIGKTIVLATGYSVAKLGVGDENKFGLDVVYRTGQCLDHMKGQTVAVVGGGDSAVGDALELAQLCPQVYLLNRSGKLRARSDWKSQAEEDPRIKILLDTKVVSLVADGTGNRLSAVKVSSNGGVEETLPATRLIVKIGYAPNTAFVRDQIETDSTGHIRVGDYCKTSLPGVFAVGDITTPGYPRIATAVGQGVLAVAGIRQYLGHLLL
ncbi:MAG: NAD(P)/FAD-dependent oxidoreductase [Candidatus Obscuribacterales bacterium]|nr:NAD(P)/FAD-dependent oxidoreductase [Candidatus Obscuribacterales bacterium]